MPTKRSLIDGAMAELGFGPLSYSMTAEDYQFGLSRLDSLMLEWKGRGLDLGYVVSTEIDDAAGTPDEATNAIQLALGGSLAPAYGKTMGREAMKTAREAYRNLLVFKQTVPEAKAAPVQRGAGDKHIWW